MLLIKDGENMLPLGAAVILVSKKETGKLLIVNRKNPPYFYCFPGGKVESLEDSTTGAQRELLEETGIIVPKEKLVTIYSGICSAVNESTYWVTSYFVEIDDFILSGEVELNPKFVTFSEFLKFSAFTSYNVEALGRAKMLGLIQFEI